MPLQLPPYAVGTATVANGGTTVVGTSTVWTNTSARELDTFVHVASGLSAFIRSLTDATHLVIDAWPGTGLSGAAYRIEKTSPLRFVAGQAMADVSALIATLNGRTFYTVVGASPTADGLVASEGQYALKTNTSLWQLWLWTSGAWVLQGSPVGTTYQGDYDSARAYAVSDLVTSAGTLYISKVQSNLNHTPASSPTQWGAAAAAGTNGTNGATWSSGTAVPSGGNDGDFYFRTTTNDVYKRAAGTWSIVANILGATGATGATPVISATSGSAVAVALNNQTFTVAAGLAFVQGQRLRITNSLLSRWMVGPVYSYSGTTLVVTVDDTFGTGTDNTWSIAITGEKGRDGGPGPQGAASSVPGPTGPASTVPGPQGIQGVTGNGLAYSASGTLTQRATYDNQAAGYAFLQTDVAPFRMWIKASNTSADWDGPTYIGGAAAVGDLGSVTDSVLTIFDYGVAA